MKMIFVLVAIAVMSGCAVSKSTYLPSGEQGHSINCSGSALTWGSCYEKAGALCGASGYEIITQSGDKASSLVATEQGLIGGSSLTRSMLIACKK